MRQNLLLHLITASLFTAVLPATAQTVVPFMRPSVAAAKAGAIKAPEPIAQGSVVAGPQGGLLPFQPEEDKRKAKEEREAGEKAEGEKKKKEEEAARRKKLGLKEGQELVEREFKGARIGVVNGINVYRAEDDERYMFESVNKHKYVHVLPKETIEAEPKASATSGGRSSKLRKPAGAGQAGEKVPDLPSAVGRPAPPSSN